MREPDVWKECWEMLQREISPTPNKSFPEGLWRAVISGADVTPYIFLGGFAVGFIYLLFYVKKKDNREKYFFKLTLKHTSPCGPYIFLV